MKHQMVILMLLKIDLTRMFVKITEDGFEAYSPNVYLVEKDKVSKLEEDDINVCFDKIRGKF